jgi:hypothetical protein
MSQKKPKKFGIFSLFWYFFGKCQRGSAGHPPAVEVLGEVYSDDLICCQRPSGQISFLTSDSRKFNLQASKLWANFKKGLANAFLLFLQEFWSKTLKN